MHRKAQGNTRHTTAESLRRSGNRGCTLSPERARNYAAAYVLLAVALAASGGAAVAGIVFRVPPEVVGAIALVPGVISVAATTLKLQAKAHWHYRKYDQLKQLRRRLLFELPQPPGQDEVAQIAKAWSDLETRMSKEWEENFAFDFSGFTSNTR